MEITTTWTAAAARLRAPSLVPTHNSITPLMPNDVPAAARPAGVVGFGAAKQGAPPRGIPR